MSFNPLLLVVAGVIAVLAAVIIHLMRQKREVTPQAVGQELGAHAQDIERRVTQAIALELARLRQRASSELPASLAGVAPPQVQSPASAPADVAAAGLLPSYVDRDDLCKAIGTNFPYCVSLDASIIHQGFGPCLAYFNQPGGGISNVQPLMPTGAQLRGSPFPPGLQSNAPRFQMPQPQQPPAGASPAAAASAKGQP